MRRFLAIVALAGAVALSAAPAGAHALLKRSDPANGAELATSPDHVTIEFTERPDPAVSVIRVVDSGGTAAPTGPTRAVPGQPRTLTVAVTGTLPDDVYTVTWRTVSREDGHVTGGSFAFGVGKAPGVLAGTPAPRGTSQTPSAAAVAGRWLLYAGLALLLGGALFSLTVVWVTPVARWPLVAGGAAAVAGSVVAMLAEQNAVGIGLRAYVASGHGTLLAREAAFCWLAALAAFATARNPGRVKYAGTGLLALVALGAHAVTGHAGAARHLRWPTIGVQWVHLVAVAAWLGALAWALAALPREPPRRAAAARRLSRLATVAVVVVAVTGTARALAEVASWHLLWSTGFGRTVLAKVAVFAVLVALGARNRFFLVPTANDDRAARGLRRTIGAEVVFGGVVFGLSGLLAGLAPALAVPGTVAPQAKPVVVRGHDYATSVNVTLTVTPGGIGPNTFAADVTDYDTHRPVEARGVSLLFTLPSRPDLRLSTLALARTAGTARWTATGSNLSIDGPWHVVVVVDNGTAGVEVPLTVTPAPPPETLTKDTQPGQPTIYTATLPDGSKVQTYLDPDTAGFTEVHVTCFDPAGTETPVTSLQVSVSAGERVAATTVRRLDQQGHFVADTTLSAGRWHVTFRAVTSGGTVLRGYADVDVRPKGTP